MYVTADDKEVFLKPFDISTVPTVTQEQALAEERTKKLTTATPTLKAPSTGPKKTQVNGATDSALAAKATANNEQLMAVPEIKPYGKLLKSSQPIELSESETEYVVTAVKHIFADHVVLQFDVKNTLTDVVLEEVSVISTPSDEDTSLQEDFIIPVSRLTAAEPGTVYVSFKRSSENAFPVTSFTNSLKFTSKEIDPTTGEPDEQGYEDEYEIEDLELAGSDYVLPVLAGNFDHVWEQTGANGEEASETLQLSNTKSIAGKSDEHNVPVMSPLALHTTRIYRWAVGADRFHRCHRTACEDAVVATIRRYGHYAIYQHSHTKALRQNSLWRQDCSPGKNGLLGEDRGNSEDHCKERGRRVSHSDHWKYCLNSRFSFDVSLIY